MISRTRGRNATKNKNDDDEKDDKSAKEPEKKEEKDIQDDQESEAEQVSTNQKQKVKTDAKNDDSKDEPDAQSEKQSSDKNEKATLDKTKKQPGDRNGVVDSDKETIMKVGQSLLNDGVTLAATQFVIDAKAAENLLTARSQVYHKDSPGILFAPPAYPTPRISMTGTPYQVLPEIPRFIAHVNTKAEVVGLEYSTQVLAGNVKQINEAVEMWNHSLLTSRVVLRDEIYGHAIPDINDNPQGALTVMKITGTKEDASDTVALNEHRLFTAYKMHLATYRKLFSIPKKQTLSPIQMTTPIAQNLVSSPLWEGDYPHIFMSTLGPAPLWYKDALNRIAEKYPLILGETDVESVNGVKTSARVSAVTDQYATAIADIYANECLSRQLSLSKLSLYALANTVEGASVIFANPVDMSSLLYDPSKEEWNTLAYYIMSSPAAKAQIADKMTTITQALKMFSLSPISDVFNPNNAPSDADGNRFLTAFSNVTEVGGEHSLVNLVWLETFACWYDIDPTFKPYPNDFSCIHDILKDLCVFILTPRIASQISHMLQYNLQTALHILLPTDMAAFVQVFGHVRKDGRKFSRDGRALTRAEAQQGLVFSVFAERTEAPVGIRREFMNLVNTIKRICTPPTIEVRLTRKSAATYPFHRDDYITFRSWEKLNFEDVTANMRTELVQKLESAMRVLSDISNLRGNNRNDSALVSKALKSVFASWESNILSIIQSAALLFNVSMAELQDQLFNCFCYVHDDFNPAVPFVPPRTLAFVLKGGDITNSGVPIERIKLERFDPRLALRVMLTGEGHVNRGFSYSTRGDPTSKQNLPSPRENISYLDGIQIHKFAMSIFEQAALNALAHSWVSILTDSDPQTNPVYPLINVLRRVMRMSNWVPLVKRIFAEVGIDFSEYYLNSIIRSGVVDGRHIAHVLNYINPETGKASTEPIPGTFYGNVQSTMSPAAQSALSVITKLVVDSNSPINKYSKGLFVGRFVVTEMRPLVPDVRRDYTVVQRQDWKLDYVPFKTGMAIGLLIRESVWADTETEDDEDAATNDTNSVQVDDEEWRVFLLPYDPEMPKLMLEMDTTAEITHFEEILSRAVFFGSLAMYIKDFSFFGDVIDVPSKTVDYSTNATPEMIASILRSATGEITNFAFISTVYASNFIQNGAVVPHYIQYFTTTEDLDGDLFCAAITNTVRPTEKTVLPTPNELSFGSVGAGGIAFLPEDPSKLKIHSAKVNWNNSYFAISKEWEDATEAIFAPGNIKWTFPRSNLA